MVSLYLFGDSAALVVTLCKAKGSPSTTNGGVTAGLDDAQGVLARFNHGNHDAVRA